MKPLYQVSLSRIYLILFVVCMFIRKDRICARKAWMSCHSSLSGFCPLLYCFLLYLLLLLWYEKRNFFRELGISWRKLDTRKVSDSRKVQIFKESKTNINLSLSIISNFMNSVHKNPYRVQSNVIQSLMCFQDIGFLV